MRTMLGFEEKEPSVAPLDSTGAFLVIHYPALHYAGGSQSMNIRHLAAAALIAAGLAAGSLISTAAQAMTLPGPIAPANAITSPLQAEQVRLVCQRVWTGRHWTRRCYHTSPRVHRHRHHYRPHHHRHHRHHHHRHRR